MPRLDGTGPNGMGPMTGWGRGNCGYTNPNRPKFDGTGPRGMGPMTGRGRGNCVPINLNQQKSELLKEIEELENKKNNLKAETDSWQDR